MKTQKVLSPGQASRRTWCRQKSQPDFLHFSFAVFLFLNVLGRNVLPTKNVNQWKKNLFKLFFKWDISFFLKISICTTFYPLVLRLKPYMKNGGLFNCNVHTPAVESVTLTSHSTIVKMWWSQFVTRVGTAGGNHDTQARLIGTCLCFFFICVNYRILSIFKREIISCDYFVNIKSCFFKKSLCPFMGVIFKCV